MRYLVLNTVRLRQFNTTSNWTQNVNNFYDEIEMWKNNDINTDPRV